jgi:hypothetical protein
VGTNVENGGVRCRHGVKQREERDVMLVMAVL